MHGDADDSPCGPTRALRAVTATHCGPSPAGARADPVSAG